MSVDFFQDNNNSLKLNIFAEASYEPKNYNTTNYTRSCLFGSNSTENVTTASENGGNMTLGEKNR